METRAHHVLIGTFTLVVVVVAVLFALWLGKASLSKQHHYYDIVFTEAVTGLSTGSPVQYNGIQVGQVSQLKLDPKDPRKVLARIQVAADTPIKTDTRAKLGLLGLTGVAFIQLSGGAPDSALLMPTPDNPVPQIKSENSALSQLLASGSDVVTNLNGILDRLGQVVSQSNVDRITSTLKNIDQTTSTLAAERDDLRKLIHEASEASVKLNQTLAGANKLVNGPALQTMERAQAAMTSLQQTTKTLNDLLVENKDSLQSGLRGVDQIGPTLRQLRATLRDIQQVTDQLQANPAAYLLGRDHPAEFTPKK
ncbi:MAG TPA: MlaD family protein [Rhodanobacteraceae bacterium]|jgi:phospholipid/cholesterol/gamma-HCH transport system substrate-binding protein|nr:MlaD family protein [Rhodanobacteraceae bacterium]